MEAFPFALLQQVALISPACYRLVCTQRRFWHWIRQDNHMMRFIIHFLVEVRDSLDRIYTILPCGWEHGVLSIYHGKKLTKQFVYRFGERDGPGYVWNKQGELMMYTFYRAGKLELMRNYYAHTSIPLDDKQYVNGRLALTIYYDDRGKVTRTTRGPKSQHPMNMCYHVRASCPCNV